MNDPATVGKQIKQKYPQYANIDDATLGQKYIQKYGGAPVGGATPPAPGRQPDTPAPDVGGYKGTTQGLGSLLKSFGLQAIPNILGAGYEAQRAIRTAAGAKDLYTKPDTGEVVQNPFLSLSDLERISKKPVETIARQTAGLGAYALPTGGGLLAKAATGAGRFGLAEAGVPESSVGQIAAAAGAGAVLEPGVSILSRFLKNPTFRVIGDKTQKIVQNATDTGITRNYNDVLTNAYKSDFAGSPDNKKLIAKIWSKFAPSTPGGEITPTDLYKIRSTLSATYGDLLYGQSGKSVMTLSGNKELKAAEVIRRAVSSELHSAVPQVEELDNIVKWYNKGGNLVKGDIPEKVKKAILAILGVSGARQIYQTLYYTQR